MGIESGTALREVPASNGSAADPDATRGRKRDRSMTRANVKHIRPDESSTLRGRSPRRATSPFDYTSRTTTPALLSPTRHLLLHHHIQKARREHCPSRGGAPAGQAQLDPPRPRSRSRGRGGQRAQRQDTEGQRSADLLSGLRNEHGASALETQGLWPASEHGPGLIKDDAGHAALAPSLVASFMPLAFSASRATYTPIQRLCPNFLRIQDDLASAVSSNKRSYTSSSSPSAQRAPQDAGPREPSSPRGTRKSGRKYVNTRLHTIFPLFEHSVRPGTTLDEVMAQAQREYDQTAPSKDQIAVDVYLRDLLSRPGEGRFNDLWEKYCALAKDARRKTRVQVIMYLSSSSGIVPNGRAMALFRQMEANSWTDELLMIAVKLFMRFKEDAKALALLKTSLARGFSAGFDYFFSQSVKRQNWVMVIDIWTAFSQVGSRMGGKGTLSLNCLTQLTAIPNFTSLVMQFEKYVAHKGMAGQAAGGVSGASSTETLTALRLQLSKLALEQPLTPPEAAVFLSGMNRPESYHQYLSAQFEVFKKPAKAAAQNSQANNIHTQRRSRRTQLQAHASLLNEFWDKCREVPEFGKVTHILRGMFEINYPHNAAALARLYDDWIEANGELDRWGFQKYLALYARKGDVESVNSLWKRYVTCYPFDLTIPGGFRSLINVHAQTGRPAEAEREMRKMQEEYGVTPDIDLRNALLKAYERANDYDKVMACFKDICETGEPDAYTYAHAMTMCAKKGDLRNTLELFNNAQRRRIAVTQEMILALVMSYCRNNQVEEAEKLCTGLADRGITSTAIWNHLILFYGMQGKAAKCQELSELMKKRNIGWDTQTYQNLLEALVRANQIQPAFSLLQQAHHDKNISTDPGHFAIVLHGAAKVGHSDMVEGIRTFMQKAGQELTFNGHVALLEAASRSTLSKSRLQTLGQGLVLSLQAMVRGPWASRKSWKGVTGDVRELRQQTNQIDLAVKLLVELDDVDTAEQLINVYTDIFPQYKTEQPLPSNIVGAIMGAYLKKKAYGMAEELWQQTWHNTLAQARRPGGAGLHAAHAYDLSRPLEVKIRMFRERNDGKGLAKCIQEVVAAGFHLTNHSWLMSIHYLAEMGQWETAMRWCEEMLMPHWKGWEEGKSSPWEKRRATNSHELQAAPKSLIDALQHEWLRLRKLAVWSAENSQKLEEIQTAYPKLHFAFITAQYENLEETTAATDRMQLNAALRKFLGRFEVHEIKDMKRILRRRLYMPNTPKAAGFQSNVKALPSTTLAKDTPAQISTPTTSTPTPTPTPTPSTAAGQPAATPHRDAPRLSAEQYAALKQALDDRIFQRDRKPGTGQHHDLGQHLIPVSRARSLQRS
ncbi:hypothetical protein S40288_02484 [Stachybotrys chartarum IBT 40288]|nr:hypothetical protein S40288_02484 [Stachybotrys chartarum IBT 40288]